MPKSLSLTADLQRVVGALITHESANIARTETHCEQMLAAMLSPQDVESLLSGLRRALASQEYLELYLEFLDSRIKRPSPYPAPLEDSVRKQVVLTGLNALATGKLAVLAISPLRLLNLWDAISEADNLPEYWGNAVAQAMQGEEIDLDKHFPTVQEMQNDFPEFKKSPTRVWKWVSGVAAAILLVVLAGGAKRLHDLAQERDGLLQKQGEIRRILGFERRVTFATHNENQPSTDLEKARPLFVVGRELVLKGTALPHLIQEIEIRVEPGLEPGEAIWEDKLPIARSSREEVVAFYRTIIAPTDGKLRTVTIRLVPTPKARVNSPEEFREDRLTYKVLVVCLRAGPVAYAPLEPARLDVPGQIGAMESARNIHGESLRDGWLVLLIRPRDVAAQPWYVQNRGKPVHIQAGQPFSVACDFGLSAKEFDIQAIVLPAEKDWRFTPEQSALSDNEIPIKDQNDRPLERPQTYLVTRKGA